MMKSALASVLRIVAALLLVALVMGLGVGGWFAWQDNRYARDLKQAQRRADKVTDREFGARMRVMPTYVCEKRAGVPVSAILVRLVHWTDTQSIAAARRADARLDEVDAPGRWADFHELARQRRSLMIDWAIANDAANARALELTDDKHVTTNLEAVTVLANDRRYRELADKAKSLLGSIQETESNLRKAVPRHYLHNAAFKRELRRSTTEGTLDLGRMYLNATRPRPVVSDAPPPSSGATPGATAVPTTPSPNYGQSATAPDGTAAVAPDGTPMPEGEASRDTDCSR